MDIRSIENPKFLKRMNIKEMDQLASEMRAFLVQSIAQTGGHLASNLGVVELTIAMHYVFNAPKDKFIFDVGHQSYIHKILTGRAKDFKTLRQYGGLSGFQKCCESSYDPWEAGHSSTALSAGLGMAIARDLNHENHHICCVVGDGAMGSGESLEALNQIGADKPNLIIIFNDNNMSISKNVGAITKGFARLRTARTYTDLKQDLKSYLPKIPIGKQLLSGLMNAKDFIKEGIVDKGIFGEFGLEYLGPVDGHNLEELINALETAKEHEGPIVVHVMTTKGKGYEFTEKDHTGKWHGVGPFNPKTGKMIHTTPVGYKSWSDVISTTLCDFAAVNKDIIAITPAMMAGSKLENFFSKYPDRAFDCGICEQHAATFAAGLAKAGKRPFLSLYSSFLQRCYDQINHDICRMDLPVVIGIDRAGLVGDDGPTHHGVFDVGILRGIPNIIIGQPKDAIEAQHMLYTAFQQTHPFAIRYARGEVPYSKVAECELMAIGSWEMVYEPQDVQAYVLVYGEDVEKVESKLASNEMPCGVINARFFKPIDMNMIDYLVEKKVPVIVYEHDMLIGGLGSAVLEYLADNNKTLQVIRLGIKDEYVPQGAINILRKDCAMDLNTLCSVLQSIIN
ncbi:MAG: 1-deoxy-D-xylulose-5-phosphate synthase [Erysipelotrichaceae bacterium]|nr:1-deoxy-D-xylulose-5-phosphate synthase [Erysipelotrichaceae bacterium]